MKKTILWITVLALSLSVIAVFGLSSCTGPEVIVETVTETAEVAVATDEGTSTTIEVPTGLKIGVNMFLGSNEWNATALEGIIAAFGPDNEIISLDPNGDVQKGAENLVTLVASGPDVIIVTVGDNASYQQGIMAAADADIPEPDLRGSLEKLDRDSELRVRRL